MMTASFQPHWDYAKFRIPMVKLGSFLEYLEFLWNGQFQVAQFKHYEAGCTLPGGIAAMWGRGSTDYALIEMKGSAINSLVPEQQCHLLKTIEEHEGTFTWVDVNIDDHRPDPPQPDDINQWIQVEKTIRLSHFQKFQFIKSETGSTYAAGDYNSKYLRIYNKHLDEKGNHVPRYEMKFKDPLYAPQVGEKLIASAKNGPSALAEACASLVIGSVNFLEIGKGTHRERDRVAPFWQKFLEELKVNPLKLIYIKVKSDMWKTISWLENTVAKSLVMADKFWKGLNKGGDFIDHLKQIGTSKITPDDEKKIANLVNFQKREDPILRSSDGSRTLLEPRYLIHGWEEEKLQQEREKVLIHHAEKEQELRTLGKQSKKRYYDSLSTIPPQFWPFDKTGFLLGTAEYSAYLPGEKGNTVAVLPTV